ncbi:hypothetical protein RhiJN_22951 [Ceratobasidium sp. AG-Ba]|nr:hypothetical protein RhiJN_22951 [Ceratobasidium sp. AG-Ba]
MTKRSAISGGYQDSSDDSDNGPTRPFSHRERFPTNAPPQTAAPGLHRPAFHLPRLGSVSSHSGTFGGFAPHAQVPGTDIVDSDSLVSRNPAAEHGNAATSRTGPNSTMPTQSRSTLILERQINALATAQEEYKLSNDEQHQRTDEKLNRILEAVAQLSQSRTVTGNLTPVSRSITPSGPPGPEPKLYLANPAPTPELIAIISKVVTEARNRVGTKKGGTENNSIKEHVRVTWYRMLGITSAKGVRPHFEDDFSEPDTLPAKFLDPETNYCQPFPHWSASLTKQTAWVPTYLLRFRSTIPNNESELSNMLRALSDEQILILLHDGPFKTAQTTWRDFYTSCDTWNFPVDLSDADASSFDIVLPIGQVRRVQPKNLTSCRRSHKVLPEQLVVERDSDMRKSKEEIDTMRSNARRYQRSDRKAAARGRYIATIPSLQGPEWEYLSHPGYTSPDESDDEGQLITKRPDYRAQWETNLFEAIQVAEHEKAKAKPGLCPRFPKRQLEITRRPIPQLERGTGTNKVIVRVALCGISKAWREANPHEFTKYAPLINAKATTKPDISAFLARYPMPDTAENAESFNLDVSDDSDEPNTSEAAQGPNTRRGVVQNDKGDADDANPDGRTVITEQPVASSPKAVLASNENFPIDPQLLSSGVQQDPPQLSRPTQPNLASQSVFDAQADNALLLGVRAGSEEAATHAAGRPAPDVSHHATHAMGPSDMPPPPLLAAELGPAPGDAEPEGAKPTRKRTRQSVRDDPKPADSSDAPQPKKRGRPAGSKNKKVG